MIAILENETIISNFSKACHAILTTVKELLIMKVEFIFTFANAGYAEKIRRRFNSAYSFRKQYFISQNRNIRRNNVEQNLKL